MKIELTVKKSEKAELKSTKVKSGLPRIPGFFRLRSPNFNATGEMEIPG